jgi:hypothetical protein
MQFKKFRCSSGSVDVMRAHRRNENTPLRLTAPSRTPERQRKGKRKEKRKRKRKRNQFGWSTALGSEYGEKGRL